MDLDAFKALVLQDINKPSTSATRIASAVAQAGQFIERNYSLQYMNRFVSFSFDTASSEPRSITLPSRPKSIEFVRIVKDDGTFHYVKRVDPRDVSGVKTDIPDGYWMDGFDYLWFDNTPGEDYPAEMGYAQKTDWSGMVGSATHWLFDNAEDVLLSRSILMLSPFLRQPKLMQLYKPMWDEGIRTLLLEDEETKYVGRDESMIYAGA